MKQRIIAAFFMIIAVIFILCSNETVILSAVGIIALMSAYEVSGAFGLCNRKKWPVCLYIILFIPAICISGLYLLKEAGKDMISLIACIYILLGFLILLLYNRKVKASEMFSALIISSVLIYFLSYMVRIRFMLEGGKYLLWAVLVGACLTDTFAYFTGRFFGKRHLAPKISPNKTVEGAVGGLFGGIVSMLIYGLIIGFINPGLEINFLNLGILGFLSAIFAQMGDLSLSLIKRETGIKDFGSFIPGHGGILDRIDSIIFVAPVTYYFLSYMPIIA